MNRKPRKAEQWKGGAEDEAVDSLPRAAQDELLLNLSIDSHMCRGADARSSYVDPDLDRRFQALKIKPSPSAAKNPSKTPAASAAVDDERTTTDTTKRVEADSSDNNQDDLFARFAALKNSIPSSSSSHSNDPLKSVTGHEQCDRRATARDQVDEDEVQKVIQWAIDAARLDPSPPSDDDDDDDGSVHRTSDEDDSDDDGDYGQVNGARKKGQLKK